jgi:hypothetical protein
VKKKRKKFLIFLFLKDDLMRELQELEEEDLEEQLLGIPTAIETELPEVTKTKEKSL